MNDVQVTYQGTSITEVKPNIPIDEKHDFKHYIYFSPFLTDIDVDCKTAQFQVNLSSQLEGTTLYYRFTTLSIFKFYGFSAGEDQYDLLKDYAQFSYLKHFELFKERLSVDLHEHLRQQLDIIRSDQGGLNAVETVLSIAPGKS
ncbi:hypothetical protein [Mucilaginibacter kameinonensis]|uniref:hypothetical protein n=1 Tax=Mucilaginibacter kameinonensis TaxID=452286 RepID=UPI000EF7C639|nr:hypothetical protein [Mucilaginibacter kameinonensis]